MEPNRGTLVIFVADKSETYVNHLPKRQTEKEPWHFETHVPGTIRGMFWLSPKEHRDTQSLCSFVGQAFATAIHCPGCKSAIAQSGLQLQVKGVRGDLSEVYGAF